MIGVILYGPPAAGKSTLTTQLESLDERFHLYKRLKMGVGNFKEYRVATRAEIEQLEAADAIVWRNARYGSVYITDEPSLRACLDEGFPVVHTGQPEAVAGIRARIPEAIWLVVELTCSKAVARERVRTRGDQDQAERMRTWEETPQLNSPDLVLNTADVSLAECARQIRDLAERVDNRARVMNGSEK